MLNFHPSSSDPPDAETNYSRRVQFHRSDTVSAESRLAVRLEYLRLDKHTLQYYPLPPTLLVVA